MPMSKKRLIEQLVYSGFSQSDAEYAANNIDVNWHEQALKQGKEYLDMGIVNMDRLKEQLKYEGFTESEADYALTNME